MNKSSSGLGRACRLAALLVVLCPPPAGGRQSQPSQPRPPLTAYLDSVARAHLKEREGAISKIRTPVEADLRRAWVRRTVLRLMGGLPGALETARKAPAVRRFGALDEDGFRVEKIAYESLPGFLVTANVYVPTKGRGPFPAVLLTPGHDPRGKVGLYSWGANLARAGMVALAYDPISEGERFQHYDPELGASKIGGVTGEHGHADLQTLLLGEHVSRYFVWDAVRGVDYLAARADVDAGRIGAFGCSGGGTVTAYLAALDERVKASAVACYVTSSEELLASPAGAQEAEQSLPQFIEHGLDFGDWVEAAAPRPYAIVSTTEDMFPFAGARRTFEEARRVYGLHGAADRLQWITGPGGHGALNPVAPDILAFFARWLKGEGGAKPSFTPARPRRPDDLLCTPTGQLSDSVGSETVHSLNRKRAAELSKPRRPLATRAELTRLQARLGEDVRTTAAVSARPGAPPPAVTTVGTTEREGYRLDALTMRTDDGLDLVGLLAVPERAGNGRAMLVLDSRPVEGVAAAGGEVERLARAGWLVLVLQPRATPAWVDEIKSPLLGPHYLLSLRARLVGKTIVGMRADDIIRAVDWLASRPDFRGGRMAAYATGPHGVALLHAAALDARVGLVLVENTLASYRMAVERPVHRNLPEVALPGVLPRYDVGDLLLALSPRPVVFINPADSLGATMREADARRELDYVFDSERNLGSRERVRLAWRAPGEPLPIE